MASRRPIAAGVLAAATAVLAACASASADADFPPLPRGHVPGQVVVRFKHAATPAQRAAARHAVGATIGRRLALPDAQLLVLPDRATVKGAAATLEARAGVRYAEPNAYAAEQACPVALKTGLCRPDDPKFNQQWTMYNTAQLIDGKSGATADADVDATEAWNITRGSDKVVVAVVDSGIAYDNPDLAGHIWHNEGELGTDAGGADRRANGVDDDGNGYVDDWQGWDVVGAHILDPGDSDNDPRDIMGHGTHVAGIIGATGNNGIGVTGLNWNVRLMNVRVRAERSNETSADIADAFVYAARNGARIVNVSLAERQYSQYLADTIAAHPDVLFVIAAGNNGEDIGSDANQSFPCEYPSANIVCVAATGRKDELAAFSNRNPQLVDIAAPGTITLSSFPSYAPIASESFETDPFVSPARWIRGGTPGSTNAWGITTEFRKVGARSIGSSVTSQPVQPGAITWIESANPYNLSGKMGCRAESVIWVRSDPDSGLFLQARTDRNFQQPSRFPSQDTPTPTSDTVSFSTGSISGFRLHTSISDLDNSRTAYLRYGVITTSNPNATPPKAWLDDLKLQCLGGTYSANGVTETAFQQGTSMATPHVAGAAALILAAYPSSSTAQLKADLLRSVDVLPGLAGKVATGGRLNVYKALARTNVAVTGGVLTVRAREGVRNTLVISRATAGGVPVYRVSDAWAARRVTPMGGSYLERGAGCDRVSDVELTCKANAITSIDVDAGDLDDTVTATGALVPVKLTGGAGNDTLTGGSAADTFAGGPGNDTIHSRDNLADAGFDCGEEIPAANDSDTVLADTKDVVTASATGCESVTKA